MHKQLYWLPKNHLKNGAEQSMIIVCKFAKLPQKMISERKFELAAWISYENGKNRYEAIADIDEAVDFIKYYSEEMVKNNGFTNKMRKCTRK